MKTTRIAVIAAVVGGAFFSGQAVAYHQARRDISDLTKEIERVKDEQAKVTDAFVTAWENQQSGIRMVSDWARFIKERDEIHQFNQKNAPVDLVARRAR